ncbi:MAG TPA: hypothetical protein VGQ46_22480 [Thermoanaerobaculia bacterium]|nr:hypothetical protein [Thermoanaerobaculia bacterium]
MFWKSLVRGENNATGAMMFIAEATQVAYACATAAVIGSIFGALTIRMGRKKLGITALTVNILALCFAVTLLLRLNLAG